MEVAVQCRGNGNEIVVHSGNNYRSNNGVRMNALSGPGYVLAETVV